MPQAGWVELFPHAPSPGWACRAVYLFRKSGNFMPNLPRERAYSTKVEPQMRSKWTKRDRAAQSEVMKRNWREGKLSATNRKPCVGTRHPFWKGDAACAASKRTRARRLYPLGKCERCPAVAIDRHHKDGNTGNNERSNIQILCRRCHMTVDGRLENLKPPAPQIVPPKPCTNCGRLSKPTWRGQCHACDMYQRKHHGELRLNARAGGASR